MVDEESAGQPVGKIENETKRGRYGNAPKGEPHLAPEVEPARGADPDVDVAPGTPGMLPENAGESPDDETSERPRNRVSGKNPHPEPLEGVKHYERDEGPELG